MAAAVSITSKPCFADPVVIVRGNLRGRFVVCVEKNCKTSVDQVASHLYNTIKKAQIFFLKVFGLCGVDGMGKTPEFELGWEDNNAAWSCQGPACKFIFNDHMALIPGVVVHEMTHSVVQHARSTSLVSSGQAGALNESIANVCAVSALHFWGNPDWNIGTLYNLSTCTDMRQFQVGTHDSGYIHANSNIPSHAFYCAVKRIQTMIPTYASFHLAPLWLNAMKQIPSSATFKDFAFTTLGKASPKIREAVASAWVHVGVLSVAVPRPLTAAGAQSPKKQSFLNWLFG